MATQPLDYQTYSAALDEADALVHKTGAPLTQLDALYALMAAYPQDPRYALAARRLAPSTTVAKAAAAAPEDGPAYTELVVEGRTRFEIGLAPDAWHGMGQVLAERPDLQAAVIEEKRVAAGLPPRPASAAAVVTKQVPAAPVTSGPPPRPAPATAEVEKQALLTAADTIHVLIKALQARDPSRATQQCLDHIGPAYRDIWDQYTVAQRAGQGHAQPVAKAAPLSTGTVIAIAKAQAATAGSSTAAALATLALAHPDEPEYWEAARSWHLSDEGLAEHRRGKAA
jgi:hypothetical protein